MKNQDNLLKKLNKHVRKISPSVRVLAKASDIADLVLERESTYSSKTNIELKNISYRIMDEITSGVSLDNFMIDGLALAREIVYRVHGQKAFKVQLIGAIITHFGDFAEMKTGEGKTLTLLLVSYLNALSHKGVHIVTVNEYLVKRDMEFSQAALGELGVTVGYVTSEMTPQQKKQMYACDITYISNSELGFDYLRDNMVLNEDEKMQRGLNFAIVDEADSILIDEARTPLIIAGKPSDSIALYKEVDKFVKSLNPNDYVIDLESHAINLNDNGISKAEIHFEISNLYNIENSTIVHKMMNALRANYIMEIGKEYIVRKNPITKELEIALVDAFTGRIMEGRMYSAGLHQAIQAKENVSIEPENVTLATITYQSLFRLYKKLAGLSGTAVTERQEFLDIYNMIVVDVPTNQPMIRVDQPDYVFGTKQIKWKYVAAEIKRRHLKGQPVLVGTVSVEDSELLHRLLSHLGIKHNILNAKNNAVEAEIIKQAGFKGAVTIATNMAGRGTDIKLEPGVVELGGLFVLGTERNEARRIDNQLRGRSGRQGDPGESRFFISLQDSLFKRFASDRFDKAQFKLGEEVIDLKFFSRLLDKTQKRVENLNYDIRKNLIDYDYVLSEQRELIYKQRNIILSSDNLLPIVQKMIARIVDVFIILNPNTENINMVHVDQLFDEIKEKLGINLDLDPEQVKNLHNNEIYELLTTKIDEIISNIYMNGNPESINQNWKHIIINAIDNNWTLFLDKIQKLRDGVSLRSYEQRSPLNIYVEDSDSLFYNITISIAQETLHAISKHEEIINFSQQQSNLKFFDNSNLSIDQSQITELSVDDLEITTPLEDLKQMQENIVKHVDDILINDTKTTTISEHTEKSLSSVSSTVDELWAKLQAKKVKTYEKPQHVDQDYLQSNVKNVVDDLFDKISTNKQKSNDNAPPTISHIKDEVITFDNNRTVPPPIPIIPSIPKNMPQASTSELSVEQSITSIQNEQIQTTTNSVSADEASLSSINSDNLFSDQVLSSIDDMQITELDLDEVNSLAKEYSLSDKQDNNEKK